MNLGKGPILTLPEPPRIELARESRFLQNDASDASSSSGPILGRASWLGAMAGVDHDEVGGRCGRTIVGNSNLPIDKCSDPIGLTISVIDMFDTI